MTTLALKYRPRTFADLVGQPQVQVVLQQMVKLGRVPDALLLDGTRGSGKTSTARILAAALNCHEPEKPCGQCASCKATFDGSSLDVIEIDAASNGLVEDIRALRQQVMFRQTGDYRIVILDEAQSMSPAAYNALLKTLEEPPPNTVFILCTTEPAKILSTVVSRCMPFTFKRLTVNDITHRLAHIADAESRPVNHDLLRLIAEKADGAMRDAIMVLDQVTRVGMTTAEQYQRLIGHHEHAETILRHLAENDLPSAYQALDTALTRIADPNTLAADITNVLRDVLVLRCGGEVNKSGTALAARQNLALALETPIVVSAMKILWQLKTQVRLADARADLELAVAMLAEALQTAAPARMSITEMSKFA